MDITTTHQFWEENSNMQRVKYEGCNSNDETNNRIKDDRGGGGGVGGIYPCCDTNLNFSTATCSEDDSEYGPYKKNKVTRQDPMSHRIIEKRRRDRMNNCLADLSRLIPTEYLKKGRGRIEKTEIIEMAIKHMKYLQQEHVSPSEHFRLGYQECMSEAMRFMVEIEGHFPREGICVRILNHLQKHCESLSRVVPPHVVVQQQATTPPPPPTPSSIIDHHLIMNNQQNLTVNHNNNNDYPIPKNEPEIEPNNNHHHQNGTTTFPIIRTNNNDMVDIYEKHHNDCNGHMSYKYKTNIKLRFNQDLNAVHEGAKRQKIDNDRRNSITSIENQTSSSRSSPPTSNELCSTRISENDNRTSPTESTSSLKLEQLLPTSRNDNNTTSFLPNLNKNNNSQLIDIKNTNFNVPIFVLHAKGSYYIPLTIDYKTLLPFLRNYDILEILPNLNNNNNNNIVLHPVTINVNFQPNYIKSYKHEFNNNNNNNNNNQHNNWN